MSIRQSLVRSIAFFILTAAANAQWLIQQSGVTAGLRGIHTVDDRVAWASGSKGTVVRTEDGGEHWERCAVPPQAEQLDFRGIWAWNSRRAIIMSIGTGEQSRLYETSDGCKSWTLLYTNPDAKGFWDAIVFLDGQTGILLGDPVGGKFAVFRSQDGGRHWSRDDSSGLTADSRGEGAFAASNSSLTVTPRNADVEFGTGGIGGPRVFRSGGRFDRPGSTQLHEWKSSPVPLTGGVESAGTFSLYYRDALNGVAVGGDYQKPKNTQGTAAFTSDGGATWRVAEAPPSGFRSGVAFDRQRKTWVAVGTNGSDFSKDDGKTWQRLESENNWNAVSLPWAVGPQGRIGKLIDAVFADH